MSAYVRLSAFFFVLFLSWPASAQEGFPDVPHTHAHFDAITYLRAQGIVDGYPDGTFGPERGINRAEFTKIVVGARFTPEEIAVCTTVSFPDVAADAWYVTYLCTARREGIIGGYPDGTFGGGKPVTFAEAAKILVRTLDPDAPTAGEPWYRAYVEYLGEHGAIPTDIPAFDHPLTRGQMAEMLYRLHAGIADESSRTYEDMTREPAVLYERRMVETARGSFDVDIVTGDLSRGVDVVTDSAVSKNCDRDCAALPLAEYVRRNNAVAGIHGSYFCPPDYAQCVDAVNSYIYFVYASSSRTFINADKRGYDNAGGLLVFREGSAEFHLDPTDFKLDTDITGAIAMWPALVSDGQALPDHPMMDEKQRTGRGAKGGMGVKGSTVYLLLARNATVPDLRDIMVALGLDHGINLDGGGSSAIYADGAYKVGPGRELPNAVLLVP